MRVNTPLLLSVSSNILTRCRRSCPGCGRLIQVLGFRFLFPPALFQGLTLARWRLWRRKRGWVELFDPALAAMISALGALLSSGVQDAGGMGIEDEWDDEDEKRAYRKNHYVVVSP